MEIEKHTIIVEDFNVLCPVTDRTSRKRLSVNIKDLNKTVIKLKLNYIYRTFTQFHNSHFLQVQNNIHQER